MLDRQRRRIIGALFVGNALSSVSFIGAITVASLVAKALTNRDDVSGVPAMVATFGAALGAVAMTAVSRKTGRRPAFILGYAIAAAGAALGLAAIMAHSFALFIGGMVVLGFGRSVSQLSRYAAGDLCPRAKRGTAISLIVWAATIGSVVGPLLIAPSGRVLLELAGEELAGPFAVGTAGFAAAALFMAIFLRPEPLTLVVEDVAETGDIGDVGEKPGASAAPLSRLLLRPGVVLALSTLAVSQLVMVMVMTMTPLHIREHGQNLGMVGWVMMAHTLGMFAIAPLTGLLVDRVGPRRVIATAVVLLAASSLMSATAADAQPVTLLVGLFVLGVGWNFGFVAASTALTEHISIEERLRLQGIADSLTWISGGIGALMSGIIVSAMSYSLLGVVGAAMAVIPLFALYRAR